MKSALATFLLLALFAGPTLCLIAVCPAQTADHDCCPNDQEEPPQETLASCPFGILAQSTGAVQTGKTLVTLAIATPVATSAPLLVELPAPASTTFVADGRNLHELNRVLRV